MNESDARLAAWFQNDKAWDAALADTVGESIPESEAESEAESDVPNIYLFAHGYLLTPMGLAKAPNGDIRVVCNSARPQKRASFFALSTKLGRVHRIGDAPYVDIRQSVFTQINAPLKSRMFKDRGQYAVFLAGSIAGQKALPGEHPRHRLTVASEKLLDDLVGNFEPNFGFTIRGRKEITGDKHTLDYYYQPVREALLGVEAVRSLGFMDRVLPPLVSRKS